MKQHAIIEKTARFIATQGAQMEILIKAKQANNAQFDFLSQGGQLQPYYRHLLAVIKQANMRHHQQKHRQIRRILQRMAICCLEVLSETNKLLPCPLSSISHRQIVPIRSS